MNKLNISLYLILLLVTGTLITSCEDEDLPISDDFGYLVKPSPTLNIFPDPNGRTQGNDVNEFVFVIKDLSGATVQLFERFADVPDSVQLPTGSYYAELYNDDFSIAAFNFPYYYGRSLDFQIDKEQVKTVNIEAEPSNFRVKIEWSDDIINTFISYSAQANGINGSLMYDENTTDYGYFGIGKLSIEATLIYNANDGSQVTKVVSGVISDPQTADSYTARIEAELINGSIVFNISLFDEWNEKDIIIGGGGSGGGSNEPIFPDAPTIVFPTTANQFMPYDDFSIPLKWTQVPDAVEYEIFKGKNLNSMSSLNRVTDTTYGVIIISGVEFIKVVAHFADGTTSEALTSLYLKHDPQPNEENLFNEVSPLPDDIITYEDGNLINSMNEFLFEATPIQALNSSTDVRLVIDSFGDGTIVSENNSPINSFVDLGNGGPTWYYYRTDDFGTANDKKTEDLYFIGITNPSTSDIALFKHFDPTYIEVNLNSYSWVNGTPYYFVQKREAGTTIWLTVGDGWTTSKTIMDTDVVEGETYEYRFKVSPYGTNADNSEFTLPKTVTLN